MGKYDQIIADARVAITDATMKAVNNADCSLKLREHLSELTRELEILEQDRYPSLASRVRDALFDTPLDAKRDEAARRAADLTYQVRHCCACRCITCPLIDSRCRCRGCLYGSHVVRCDGGEGTETREFERGVYMVDGMPAVRAEYDRLSCRTVITLIDRGGAERRWRFDPETGAKSPL